MRMPSLLFPLQIPVHTRHHRRLQTCYMKLKACLPKAYTTLCDHDLRTQEETEGYSPFSSDFLWCCWGLHQFCQVCCSRNLDGCELPQCPASGWELQQLFAVCMVCVQSRSINMLPPNVDPVILGLYNNISLWRCAPADRIRAGPSWDTPWNPSLYQHKPGTTLTTALHIFPLVEGCRWCRGLWVPFENIQNSQRHLSNSEDHKFWCRSTWSTLRYGFISLSGSLVTCSFQFTRIVWFALSGNNCTVFVDTTARMQHWRAFWFWPVDVHSTGHVT